MGGKTAGDTVADPVLSYGVHHPFDKLRTGDHALNPLFRQNKQVMYDLMFQTVSEVLQEKAGEELGCE